MCPRGQGRPRGLHLWLQVPPAGSRLKLRNPQELALFNKNAQQAFSNSSIYI